MLEVRGLKVSFAGKTVLGGIDLDARSGEVVVLVGANGSGKTTLFRAVAGAVAPDEGIILVDGERQIVGARVAPVSYVSDRRVTWRIFTPRHVLRRFAAIHGLGRREAKVRIEGIATDLGMHEYLDKRQDRLSTGQAAKFAIARMMLRPYPTILLDEPSAGLDFNATAAIRRLVRDLAAKGHAVVVTSHRMDEIVSIADRILILRDGRIVLETTPDELDVAALPDLIGVPR